jgi:hypothetical protein
MAVKHIDSRLGVGWQALALWRLQKPAHKVLQRQHICLLPLRSGDAGVDAVDVILNGLSDTLFGHGW